MDDVVLVNPVHTMMVSLGWGSSTLDRKAVNFVCISDFGRPPLWSSGQCFWLQIQRSRVRFPALPDFLSGSGSGTGFTQPREVN